MRQFRDWQFTKGAVDAPQEYVDYILCAHVYHCTPTELDQQPALLTGLHLDFFNEELQQRSSKRTVKRGKRQRVGKSDTSIMNRLSDDARQFIQRIISGEQPEGDT